MKVVQILYSGLGGHGSVALSLAAAAAGHWQSDLIFFGIEPLLPEYERLCRERNIGFQHVPMRQGYAWGSWGSLYRALARMAPGAIILHSVKAILPCWFYARRRGVPLIAVEHQPNSLKKRSEWVVSRLLMWLADAVVVLTPQYRTELRAGIGRSYRAGKVHLIPNGIDLSAFSGTRQPAFRSGEKLRVGMAARFTNAKRQELLIDAIAHLSNNGSADAWSLSLAGSGENLTPAKLRAENAGLSKLIEFKGYLGEQELLGWFRSLDFYAHASDGETLSTSLLQAMAMGLPIAGSNVPGISELLAKEGGCGTTVSGQSGEAFAEALRKLHREPETAREFACNARRLVEAEYSQAAMFAAYRDLVDLK